MTIFLYLEFFIAGIGSMPFLTALLFLQRHVGVLLPGVLLLLPGEQVQVLTDPPPGGPWLDDVVDVAADGRRERVAELLDVLFLLLGGSLA